MIKVTYSEQRTFPEYVDMYFREIFIVDSCDNPLTDWWDMLDLLERGYWFDDPEMPSFMEKLYDWEGSYRKSGVTRRRVKKYCKKIIELYAN